MENNLKHGDITRLAREAGVSRTTMKYRLFPERTMAILKKSYLKHRTKRIIQMRDYYEANRERLLAYAKKYWKEHPKKYDAKKEHLKYLKKKNV